MNVSEIIFFTAFILFIVLMLAFDLGVLNRENKLISLKKALIFTGVWVGFALIFYGLLYFRAEWIHGISTYEHLQLLNLKHGHHLTLTGNFETDLLLYRKAMSLEYITGFLIEKTLSVDNIFVIILIFGSFNVDPKYYHKILFYGVLGAIVMRFVFIFLSAALIHKFSWFLAVFGLILLITGIKMFFTRHQKENIDPNRHFMVRFLSRYFAVSPVYDNGNFFTKINGKRLITPLLVVLLVVEFSDVIFAVDSIPAIFAITQDPYIVFFSNIFAILGLRSIFFVLSSMVERFRYLKTGLSVLLVFIGVKMLLSTLLHIEISAQISLLGIFLILGVSILWSFVKGRGNCQSE